jgi:hypothetical protein
MAFGDAFRSEEEKKKIYSDKSSPYSLGGSFTKAKGLRAKTAKAYLGVEEAGKKSIEELLAGQEAQKRLALTGQAEAIGAGQAAAGRMGGSAYGGAGQAAQGAAQQALSADVAYGGLLAQTRQKSAEDAAMAATNLRELGTQQEDMQRKMGDYEGRIATAGKEAGWFGEQDQVAQQVRSWAENEPDPKLRAWLLQKSYDISEGNIDV